LTQFFLKHIILVLFISSTGLGWLQNNSGFQKGKQKISCKNFSVKTSSVLPE